MHIEFVEYHNGLGPQEVEEQSCSSLWGEMNTWRDSNIL